jgi:hypothetical protein
MERKRKEAAEAASASAAAAAISNLRDALSELCGRISLF